MRVCVYVCDSCLCAQMADEWRRQRLQNKNVPMPAELAKHLQGDKEHHHHIPHPHFYFHEMPTWVVSAGRTQSSIRIG